METVQLNNGIEMPILGFGTYQMPSRITKECVLSALREGYRLVDTAQCYGNEYEVGQAIRESGIPREELFITTKLWGTRGYEDTLRSIDHSLNELGLDYIDLLLMHEPTGDIHEIYRAMEKAYKDGKVGAIGVSNFLEDDFSKLLKKAEIVPAVNQLETHVYRQQEKMQELEEQVGTRHQSWSPLACGRNGIFKDPVLVEIAQRHSRTPAQVALRFLTQQGIIVIPKTTHKERMIENLHSLDFDLTQEEIERIKTLEVGKSLFNWW